MPIHRALSILEAPEPPLTCMVVLRSCYGQLPYRCSRDRGLNLHLTSASGAEWRPMAQRLFLARRMDLQTLAILSNMVVGMEPEAWCTLGKSLATEWQQELQPHSDFQVN